MAAGAAASCVSSTRPDATASVSGLDFVEQVDENLTCQICYEVMTDPRAVRCGHCFCRDCILRWITRGTGGTMTRASCPLCREDIDTDSLRPIPPLKALIEAQKVYCRFKSAGCRETPLLGEIGQHCATCVFAPATCPDCQMVIVQHSMGSHREEFHPNGSEQKLKCRVTQLERDLGEANTQLRCQRQDLASLHRQQQELIDELDQSRSRQAREEVPFDEYYQYGDTEDSVVDLARFISFYLYDMPRYVNRNRIFECMGRCHSRFLASHSRKEVCMLLAVAAASNWFSDNQNYRIQVWLESCPWSDYIETDDSDEGGPFF